MTEKEAFFWLASYPRSGNTLTRILLDHYFGINARSDYGLPINAANSPLTRPIHEVRADAKIVAMKTHERRNDKPDVPALVVARDGRDAVVSLAHYLKKHHNIPLAFRVLLKRIVNNRGPKDSFARDWSRFYDYWCFEHPAPTALLRYEDLVPELGGNSCPPTLLAALRELVPGIEPITDAQPPSFEALHKDKPTFFRRGVIGGWKDELDEDLAEEFWRRNETMMIKLGYSR